MKALVAILFLTSCAFAGSTKYTLLQCKQKASIEVNYAESANSVSVKIKADSFIQDFKIVNIRGLDGLIVSPFALTEERDLERGEEITSDVTIQKPQSLSYLVLDLEGTVNSVPKKQTLNVPVGNSFVIKARKMKNTSGKKKRHEMKLETSN